MRGKPGLWHQGPLPLHLCRSPETSQRAAPQILLITIRYHHRSIIFTIGMSLLLIIINNINNIVVAICTRIIIITVIIGIIVIIIIRLLLLLLLLRSKTMPFVSTLSP